eukprot:268915_1
MLTPYNSGHSLQKGNKCSLFNSLMIWIWILFTINNISLSSGAIYTSSRRVFFKTSSSPNTCTRYIDLSFTFDDTTTTIDISGVFGGFLLNQWVAIGFPDRSTYTDTTANLMESYAIAVTETSPGNRAIQEFIIESNTICDVNKPLSCFTLQPKQDLLNTFVNDTHFQFTRALDTQDSWDFQFEPNDIRSCTPYLVTVAIGGDSEYALGDSTSHAFGKSFMYFYRDDQVFNSSLTAFNSFNTIDSVGSIQGTQTVSVEMDRTSETVHIVHTIYDNGTLNPEEHARFFAIGFPDWLPLNDYYNVPDAHDIDFVNMYIDNQDWEYPEFVPSCGVCATCNTPSASYFNSYSLPNTTICAGDINCTCSTKLSNGYNAINVNSFTYDTNGWVIDYDLSFRQCGYEFNPNEYETCRLFTMVVAGGSADDSCASSWYLGHEQEHNTATEQINLRIPTPEPTGSPTEATVNPTRQPSINPTMFPTLHPTKHPTEVPTTAPSRTPTTNPTTSSPSKSPTNPTINPTLNPTLVPTLTPTMDPSKDPTRNPTTEPTFDPTIDPTADPTENPTNPTENPTKDPTMDPTDDPTRDPTIDPTIDPTQDPTSDPTIDPTSHPTMDPTFVLLPCDKTSWPLEIDFTFVTDTNMDFIDEMRDLIVWVLKKVVVSITVGVDHWNERKWCAELLPEKFIVESTNDVKQRRRLFADTTSYKATAVVDINEDLKSDIFVDDFNWVSFSNTYSVAIGTKLQSRNIIPDAQSIQITDIDINEINPGKSKVLDFALITLITLLSFGVLLMIVGQIIALKTGADDLHIFAIALFLIYVWDQYSDIFFAISLYNSYVSSSPFYIGLFVATLTFILVPFAKNVKDLWILQEKWKTTQVLTDRYTEWIDANGTMLFFLSFLCGSTYAPLMLVNSNLFGWRLFSMGLSQKELKEINQKRVINVVLMENAPQLVIQVIFLGSIRGLSGISLLAIISSSVSICVAILSSMQQRKMNKGGKASTSLFSFKVSYDVNDVNVDKELKEFEHKPTSLSAGIAEMLKLDSKTIECLPIQRFTDQTYGGSLEILFYIRTATKTFDQLNHELQESTNAKDQQNSFLAKQIIRAWNMQSNVKLVITGYNSFPSNDDGDNTTKSNMEIEIAPIVTNETQPNIAGESQNDEK